MLIRESLKAKYYNNTYKENLSLFNDYVSPLQVKLNVEVLEHVEYVIVLKTTVRGMERTPLSLNGR